VALESEVVVLGPGRPWPSPAEVAAVEEVVPVSVSSVTEPICMTGSPADVTESSRKSRMRKDATPISTRRPAPMSAILDRLDRLAGWIIATISSVAGRPGRGEC